MIDQAVEAVQPLVEKKRHELSLSISSEKLLFEGDATRFEQILVNLLTNAAKYSDDEGRIWLSAEPEGEELVIKIRDAGVGIPPEKLPEMFELFAQADRSLARSEGGLGIGLSLVRQLTELHGGSVTAESEGLGKGSEFTVRLPVLRTPATAELPTVILGPQTNGSPVVSTKSRVLIVDDNQDTARGMARLLKVLGHKVTVAYDGPSAIEKARELRPDVVLLDIGLAGMNGYEVAQILRKDPCCEDSILIAASGYGQEEDRRRCREAGFNHHLVKPVDYDLLISLFSKQAPPPASHVG